MSYFMITSIHFSVTISILQSLKRDNKHLTSFTEFIISSSIYILSLMKLLINYKLFQIIIRTYFSELSLRLFSRAIKHSTTKIGQSAIRLSLTIILFAQLLGECQLLSPSHAYLLAATGKKTISKKRTLHLKAHIKPVLILPHAWKRFKWTVA